MPFTPEELAAMAAADAEIEAEFFLTNEEAAASSARDREARCLAKDKRGQAVAEYQRRYYEANKEKWKQYAAAKNAKKTARGGKPTDGAPEKPA
nr:MAG TPA: hypothetical protein [Caudoviricetes sp.]DAJ85433.1 MAG TPA: hypothetical protein [Caudoviricetes sp.]